MSRPEAVPNPSRRTRSPESRGLAAGICHRVKNDLQTVANLLFLAEPHCESPEQLARAVESRTACLAAAYTLVAQSGEPPVLAALVRLMAERCLARYSIRDKPSISVPDLTLSLRLCSPLALWLGECIGNAAGHGHAGRGGGLSIDGGLEGGLWLEVRDFGPGPPPGLDLEAELGLGLGLRLARAVASSDLRGSMELTGADPGTRARLQVPAEELDMLNREPWN